MARLTQLRGNGHDQGKVSGPQCVLLRLGGTSEGPFWHDLWWYQHQLLAAMGRTTATFPRLKYP